MKNYLLIGLSALLLAFVSPLPDVPAKPEDINSLLVGETIPDLTLLTMAGQPVNLKAEVAKKPTLLVFYRGGWCPFCNKQLAELRTLQPNLERMGYQMIAISTDAPEGLKASYDKNELTYTLLSDADVAAGWAFGLAFKAPAGYSETLTRSSNGKNVDKLLPVPAVFVLDTKGVIKYEHINPNVKERVSGNVLKAVAEALQ